MTQTPLSSTGKKAGTSTTPRHTINCPANHEPSCATNIAIRIPPQISGSECEPLKDKPADAAVAGEEPSIRVPRSAEAPFQPPYIRKHLRKHGVVETDLGHSEPLYRDYRAARKRKFSARDNDDTSCSGSELDSPDSENDSTSDQEYEHEVSRHSGVLKNPSDTYYLLPPDHVYQPLRNEVVRFIYGLLRKWATSVRYIIPPDHRIRHRKKRARRVMYIEEEDPNDSSVVIISPFHGYYHLACPFYISNTVRHRRCPVQHNLRSIEDVVEHIEHHHIEPPFCHICGKLFDGFKSRNDHLRRDICDRRDGIELDGASSYQRARIMKRDDPDLNEEDRWRRIYSTLFRCKSNVSPYLMQGEAFKFSLFHDYWSSNGKREVHQYLSDHGYMEGCMEDISREFDAFCSLVFEDLTRKIESEQDAVSWE